MPLLSSAASTAPPPSLSTGHAPPTTGHASTAPGSGQIKPLFQANAAVPNQMPAPAAASPKSTPPDAKAESATVASTAETSDVGVSQNSVDQELAQRMKLFKEQLAQISKQPEGEVETEESGSGRGRGDGGKAVYSHPRGSDFRRGVTRPQRGGAGGDFGSSHQGAGEKHNVINMVNPEFDRGRGQRGMRRPFGRGRARGGFVNPDFNHEWRGGGRGRQGFRANMRGRGDMRGRGNMRGRGGHWERQGEEDYEPYGKHSRGDRYRGGYRGNYHNVGRDRDDQWEDREGYYEQDEEGYERQQDTGAYQDGEDYQDREGYQDRDDYQDREGYQDRENYQDREGYQGRDGYQSREGYDQDSRERGGGGGDGRYHSHSRDYYNTSDAKTEEDWARESRASVPADDVEPKHQHYRDRGGFKQLSDIEYGDERGRKSENSVTVYSGEEEEGGTGFSKRPQGDPLFGAGDATTHGTDDSFGEKHPFVNRDGPTVPSLQKGGASTVIPGLGSTEETDEKNADSAEEDETEMKEEEEEELKSSLKLQLFEVFGGTKAKKMVESMERIVNQLQTLKGLESSLKVLQDKSEAAVKVSMEADQEAAARKKVAALLATESDSEGEVS